MPNDIEEQIATYFQWVEARTGFPLHSDTAQAIGPDTEIDDASVIELDVPNRPNRWSTLRLVAIAGVAAAVIVGVILIANRPVDEPSVPANSGPPIDTVAQDEAARQQEAAEAAFEELQRQAQEARRAADTAEATREAAEAAEAAARNAVLPVQATMATLPSPLPTLPGSWIGHMQMTDASSGWVVTSDVLAHTVDNGATWTTHPLPSLRSFSAAQCFVLDSGHAWIARSSADGGVVVTKSADGNATTTTTTIETGFADGIPSGIVFVDPDNGFVSIVDPATQSATLTGTAHLFRTVDGGDTFELVNADSPVPLAFSDSQHGWGTGKGLFVTTDAAASWTRVRPPLWDSQGPDPTGPAYQIISTSPTLTVVKVTAPTGTMAQVRYAATTDQGTTWADVAPPGTGEVSTTGPQSVLAVVADTNWFAIQPGENQDATLWTRTTAEGSYHSTHLPFPALTITMTTPTVGWSATETEIFSTGDGGATWTKIADLVNA